MRDDAVLEDIEIDMRSISFQHNLVDLVVVGVHGNITYWRYTTRVPHVLMSGQPLRSGRTSTEGLSNRVAARRRVELVHVRTGLNGRDALFRYQIHNNGLSGRF